MMRILTLPVLALAGAAFAGEVGEALVASLIETETAVIIKAVADLAIGNDTAADAPEWVCR